MTFRIKSIRDISLGVFDGPHATPVLHEQGAAVFLGIPNLMSDGSINLSSARWVSENDVAKWNRRVTPRARDIVFTYEATLNRYAIIPENLDCCLGRRTALIRPNEAQIDHRFLFYYFFSPQWRSQIESNVLSGATVDRIPLTKFPEFQILVPDIGIQRQIADVLSSYDDLIETNRRRIALLEESARLLYREWFVNLRFPGYELVKWQDGLPEGWLAASLTELVDCNPKTVFEKGKSYPFVPMQSLSESGMVIGTREERVISGGAKFQNLDTLLARITPCLENGKTAFVQFLDEERPVASGSTEFIVMRSKTVNPYWVYCLARDESFREHAIRSMAGADGRQRVNPKCFETYMTYQAPELILKEFETLVAPVFEQVETLARQNVVLMAARDELLPKLMSGAIRV